METKSLIKSLLVASITVGVVLLGSYQFFSPQRKPAVVNSTLSDSSFGWKFPVDKFRPGGQVTSIGAFSDIRDPGGVPRGLPVRLQIPTIGVDTAVEDAYITSDGRMDVPAGSVNVAWFALGPRPGQIGSAVIGGHYGIDHGVPKVFYNLSKLIVGDKIYVIDDKDQTLAFVVRSIKLFDRNADATSVFTSNDNLAHLNVITCEGSWNQVNDSYPDRRVVFTDAIPSEGAIKVKPMNQVVIVKTPPRPVVKPSLPETAIPPKLSTTAASKITPTVQIIPKQTKSSDQGFLQNIGTFIKSMYGNLFDGLISSVIIILIIFVSVKIFRR